MQAIIFKLNSEQFALDTKKVQGINDNMAITRVPKAPAYIKGLINIRGNICSLVDINFLLDLPNDNNGQYGNIIMVNIDNELVGIAVDSVSEVLEFAEDSIVKSIDLHDSAYIKGIVNLDGRIVTVIDINDLINSKK